MGSIYLRFFLYIVALFALALVPLNFAQEQLKHHLIKAQVVSVTLIQPPQKKKKLKKKVVKKVLKKPKKKPKPKLKPKPKPLPKPLPIVKKIEPKPEPKIEPKPEPVVEKKEVIEKKEEPPKIDESYEKEQIALAREAKKTYFDEIYEVIAEKKRYPKKARRYKQEGSIKVSFKVLRDGTITELKLLEKSKYKSLNKAVKKLFNKLQKFHQPPSNLSFPLELSITINYRLKR